MSTSGVLGSIEHAWALKAPPMSGTVDPAHDPCGSGPVRSEMEMMMPEIDVQHTEKWVLEIHPSNGDDPWPDRDHPYLKGRTYRPERIRTVLVRGNAENTVSIRGRLLKIDGTPGMTRVDDTFYQDPPEWAAELVEKARVLNDLGPGTTGCDW